MGTEWARPAHRAARASRRRGSSGSFRRPEEGRKNPGVAREPRRPRGEARACGGAWPAPGRDPGGGQRLTGRRASGRRCRRYQGFERSGGPGFGAGGGRGSLPPSRRSTVTEAIAPRHVAEPLATRNPPFPPGPRKGGNRPRESWSSGYAGNELPPAGRWVVRSQQVPSHESHMNGTLDTAAVIALTTADSAPSS